jgi:hypothetical protein
MIEVRITSPTIKGINNTVSMLEQVFHLSKKSLPYPYRNRNTEEVKYTVYIAIDKWKK